MRKTNVNNKYKLILDSLLLQQDVENKNSLQVYQSEKKSTGNLLKETGNKSIAKKYSNNNIQLNNLLNFNNTSNNPNNTNSNANANSINFNSNNSNFVNNGNSIQVNSNSLNNLNSLKSKPKAQISTLNSISNINSLNKQNLEGLKINSNAILNNNKILSSRINFQQKK